MARVDLLTVEQLRKEASKLLGQKEALERQLVTFEQQMVMSFISVDGKRRRAALKLRAVERRLGVVMAECMAKRVAIF